MSDVITTYLQDHHAGSAGGVDAFRRVASGHGDPQVREEVARVGEQVEEDQQSLEQIMASLGVKPAALKDLPARVGEKLARLKPNERISTRSPLSDVEELEALILAVEGKSLLWALLGQLDDPRLDRDQLSRLHERALDQAEQLNQLHLSQAGKLKSS